MKTVDVNLSVFVQLTVEDDDVVGNTVVEDLENVIYNTVYSDFIPDIVEVEVIDVEVLDA